MTRDSCHQSEAGQARWRLRAEKALGAVGLVAILLLPACGGNDSPTPGLLSTQGSAALACPALSGYILDASKIGLATTGGSITSALLVAADAPTNNNGEYCLVKGALHAVDRAAPDILFELNIPTKWNQRALQLGGGGYNGSVVSGLGGIPFAPMPTTPLARGYATYGSDSGHQGALPVPSSDASFALNAEALVNFGYASIKKTHDAAAIILKAYFGSDVSYKSYFAGGSTGGREALTAVQRFPADYDGVFVGSPTAIFWGLRMIGLPVGQGAYGPAGGYVNPIKQALVFQTSVAACDLLDGVADKIISNVPACQAKAPATMASLRCPGGADTGNTCLSDAQLSLMSTLHAGLTLPYAMADNSTTYPGYNVFEGTDFSNNASTLGLGTSSTLLSAPTNSTNGYLFSQGLQWVRYFVTQNPTFDPLTFDPLRPGIYQKRVVELSGIVGATNPDLSAFQARGGKLIMLQGLSDSAVSPNGTILLYSSFVQKMGQVPLDRFMRFYQVPGMGHGIGTFVPSWDVMSALDAWVTSGTAPGTLTGTDTVASTAGRTRPLCVYPAWPKYNGSGDVNLASSFTCSTS